MAVPNGKTPKQILEENTQKLEECKIKYNLLDDRRKWMANGIKLEGSIKRWTEKVIESSNYVEGEVLSKGARSHLKKVYAFAKYGKWSAGADKGTRETKKGVIAEIDSIRLICSLENKDLCKNEERISNDFLTGIPDLFIGSSIYEAQYLIDVKTSWDIETFLNNLGKPLNNSYWWQIQGYMAITGAKLGEVSFCLVNTPESLLNQERFRLKERLDSVTDIDPVFLEAEKQLVNNMTFNDIPEKERRIQFLVERDNEAIGKVYKKVVKCREYLSEIEELHLQGTFLAKEPELEEEKQDNGENNE